MHAYFSQIQSARWHRDAGYRQDTLEKLRESILNGADTNVTDKFGRTISMLAENKGDDIANDIGTSIIERDRLKNHLLRISTIDTSEKLSDSDKQAIEQAKAHPGIFSGMIMKENEHIAESTIKLATPRFLIFLLQCRPDFVVEKYSNGDTLLHIAVREGDATKVSLLMQRCPQLLLNLRW